MSRVRVKQIKATETSAIEGISLYLPSYQRVGNERDGERERNTPNANMADHSVVARDELHESEVSQSLMFYFDNASPEKSCFIVDLFCFISLCLRVAVFLNATRKDRNLPPSTSKGK